jgi:hypothetical protein
MPASEPASNGLSAWRARGLNAPNHRVEAPMDPGSEAGMTIRGRSASANRLTAKSTSHLPPHFAQSLAASETLISLAPHTR